MIGDAYYCDLSYTFFIFLCDLYVDWFLLLQLLVYYAALLPRRGPHIASHSVCLSVRPSRYRCQRHVAQPSELQWHTCTFRQALRAAYRTAISAAQANVIYVSLSVFPLCKTVSVKMGGQLDKRYASLATRQMLYISTVHYYLLLCGPPP